MNLIINPFYSSFVLYIYICIIASQQAELFGDFSVTPLANNSIRVILTIFRKIYLVTGDEQVDPFIPHYFGYFL